jgi:DNA-binding CsgD family transcriptional regulator/catechol 2,3-dioxygenase-like lactoylglutathione lyase family enzyme
MHMSNRSRGRPRHPDVLTPTEWSVLDMYRHGMPRRAIAWRRGTSEYAVRYHLRNAASKLGLSATRDLRHWQGSPATSPVNASERRSRRFKAMTSENQLGELAQVSLLCRSAAAAETWYRDVLRLPHVFTFGPLVFFDMQGTRLFIREVPEKEFRASSIRYFAVDDINVATDVLKGRGVKFQGAPHMIYKDDATGLEEWFSFFEDPDGNTLSLLARVAP